MAEDVIPWLRTFATTKGKPTDNPAIFHFRGAISTVLSKQYGGSSGRVMATLRELRILTLVDFGRRGKVYVPPTYAINVRVSPDPRTIQRVLVKLSTDAMERRRQQLQEARREERLAGEHGTEAEGGPVETRHFHDLNNPLTHEHHGKTGLHFHTPLVEAMEPTPEAVALGSAVNWMAVRHHTHEAKEPGGNGTRATVVEGLAGDHPAMLVTPEGDGRYRGLLDIISELETKLRAREVELDRLDSRRIEAERERDELRAILDRATDPSVEEAEAKLREYGKS
jgi:hypothetical protein